MKVGEFIKDFLAEMQNPTMKVKCFKCGKEIELPNPSIKIINSWGCASKAMFIVANLISQGWHIRNRGITDNHPYYCPDCWDGTEPEYTRHPITEIWVEKGKEWLKSILNEN